MLKNKITLISIITFLLCACAITGITATEESQDIANPASVYCIDQGGTLDLRTGTDGGMYGVCIFADGSECEEWAYFHNECQPGQFQTASIPGQTLADEEVMLEMDVNAWYGRVESASADTASSDMRFILWPEGTGDIMISGETDEINTQLGTLRDAEGQDKDAHLWGTLTCDSSDKGQCHLSVDRVRAMDNTPPGEPEEVADLIGLVYSGPPEPSSGGDDYLALIGPFNIQYGLHGASEDVESQLAAIRDSGQAINLTGQLMVGVPDWGGTQILVSKIEIADIDPNRLKPLTSWPPAPEWPPVDTGWQTFTNDRYGYQINYPTGAEIEWTGINGYPIDELPQGMDPDQYMQQLEAQYGDNLCVTIYFSLGYIHILPDWENSINYSVCGRTGVGVGEMLDKTDILTIDGMSYTVNGYEWLGGGESLSLHNETMVVILNNGTRIEYGARPVEDASFEDYLMKTRDTLLLIVQSYQALP